MHHHNVVFAIAGTVFILLGSGFLIVEAITWVSRKDEQGRQADRRPPNRGYFGHVSAVMTGPPMKTFRERVLTAMMVFGIVGLAALLF